MIKVKYNNNKIVISGHANYAETGKDIVCASVSSVIYTTVNGIKNINENSIKFTDTNDVMTIDVISKDSVTIKLIDNMLELLKDLERQYPQKISLSKGE